MFMALWWYSVLVMLVISKLFLGRLLGVQRTRKKMMVMTYRWHGEMLVFLYPVWAIHWQSQGRKLLNYDLQILHDHLQTSGQGKIVVAFQDSEAFDSGLLGEVINLFRYEGVYYNKSKLKFLARGWTGFQLFSSSELRRLLNYFMKDCPEEPSVVYMVLSSTWNRPARRSRKCSKSLWRVVKLLYFWVMVLLHYSSNGSRTTSRVYRPL